MIIIIMIAIKTKSAAEFEFIIQRSSLCKVVGKNSAELQSLGAVHLVHGAIHLVCKINCEKA